MIALLAVLAVLAVPVGALVALLWLANVLEARRRAVVERQIALTDAIHGVLGPVVAPVVRRGRRGWIGVLPVPAGHPDLGLMVAIAQAELGPEAEVVVLTTAEPVPARPWPAPRPALAA